MFFDTRGIDWPVETEKSKWLKIPEHCKRCYINNHRLLRKRDPDCDAVFIAAGLITIVYKNYPEAKNRKPYNIYEDILTGEF